MFCNFNLVITGLKLRFFFFKFFLSFVGDSKVDALFGCVLLMYCSSWNMELKEVF